MGLRSPDGNGVTPVVRRNKALGIGLGVVIAASSVSWAVASRVRSPAEVAARTAPPTPSLISVPVERRVLSSDVVVRGTVRYGAPQEVTLPVSAVKGRTGIVTTPAVKGNDLREGSVALSVSGRPVFVLQGAQPAYRDMGPGAKGEDVRQLEQALARLGFKPGPVDGVYDTRTAQAVAAWYEAVGWTPMAPTEEQLQAMRSAQADWFAAQAEVLQAQEGLAQSERDLVTARERAATPAVPLPPVPPPAAATPAPVASADVPSTATAVQERMAAAVSSAVGTLGRLVELAIEKERLAQDRLDEANSQKPRPSKKKLEELSKALQEASDRVTAAQEDFNAVKEAAAEIAAAWSDATPSKATETPAAPDAGREGAVAAREAALAAREAKLDEITSRAEVDKAATAIDFARGRVALMLKHAASIPGTGNPGVHVPADEVLFFPSLPLRVDDTKLRRGEEVAGPVMTVTNSRLIVDAALTSSDAKLVRQGAPVILRAPDVGIDTTGTVTQIASTPGTNGVDPQRVYLEVTPADISPSLVGASVVQTITVGSTQGEVLTVPASALSVSTDGSTQLQVERPDGTTQQVQVTPGLAAKGLVAVTPVGARLSAGDLVVVGREGGQRAPVKAASTKGALRQRAPAKAAPTTGTLEPQAPVKEAPANGALGFWGSHGR